MAAATPSHPVDTHAAHLLGLLESCTDLSSASDEVELACTSWHDAYHLSTNRANVLRALPLPPAAVVLELGARAGALTRYLGETSVRVDALEPDPGLAAVATHRCADLDGVDVRVGWLDDVPAEPRYDVVIAIDVLDQLRRRGDDLTSFVAACRRLLTPRGVLVLGADNAHGVRFLAGDAPPALVSLGRERPPRVSADEIDAAVRAAGLVPTILGAFPDHRSARTLLDPPRLEAVAPAMLLALPGFGGDSAQERLWASAVGTGSAREAVNGFVAIASADGVESPAAATYWSLGRRAALSATNRVLPGDGSGPVVQRTPTFPDATAPDGPLRLRPHTEPLLSGTPMTGLLAATTDLDEARRLLREWSLLVDRSVTAGRPVPWDLIPRNVLQVDGGELVAFDQEWEHDPAPDAADLVRRRGSFWLAYDLLTSRRPTWLRGTTIGESADFLLRLARPDAPGDWLRTFFDHESIDMSHVWPTTPRHTQPARARRERNSVSSLSNMIPPEGTHPGTTEGGAQALQDVVDSLATANADLRAENEALRLEQRRTALAHRDHTLGLVAELETLRDRLTWKQTEARRHKERVLRLQKELADLKGSTSWQVGSRLVRPLSAASRKRRR